MKYKKYLLTFLFTFLFLFIDTVVEAAPRDNLTFSGSSSAEMLYGKNYLPLKSDGTETTVHFSKKKNPISNKYATYCIESSDAWFDSGTKTYSYNGELSSKIAYVLGSGYPNKSLTGNADKDYFITGLTVFYLIDDGSISFSQFNFDYNKYTNSTYGGHTSDVASAMAKLIDGANKYSSSGTTPSIDLDVQNTGLTLSSDGKYYVSKPISVTSTGIVGNYTVSLTNPPKNTIVTDTNGNIKSTFAPTAKFLVKVPVSSISSLSVNVSIGVSATGTTYKAYRYNPPAAEVESLQSVVIGESLQTNLSKTISLTQNITTHVEISKVDITDNKELPGAHIVIKDAKGNVKDEWDSTDTVHIVTPMLEPGRYTLTETRAPEGYKLSTETITFDVTADGKTVKKTMKNYPDNYEPVKISKQDATTGKELPGAKLELKDSNGELVEEWISKDTPYEIELEPGKYTLTETIAPDEYELSEETIEFTVEKDGTVKEPIIMKNEKKVEPVPTGDAFIYFAWIIGAAAVGYSIYYFNNMKKEEL